MIEYRAKAAAVATAPAEYVLSDGLPDRTGDIIEQNGWLLDEFSPSALFNHHRDAVVGRWDNLRVVGGRLIGKLVLSSDTENPVVRMVRSLISEEMLEAVSVGFRPLEAEPIDKKNPYGPTRFKKSELLEASLVTVPANPRARRIAKSFYDDAAIDHLFGVPADVARTLPGKHAETKIMTTIGGRAMTAQTIPLGKRIEAAELKAVHLKDELTKVSGEITDAPTDEQAQHVEILRGEIETAEKSITTLKNIEAGLALKATQSQIRVPATVAKRIDPREHIFRAATVNFIAKIQQRPVEAVLAERYPGDDGTGLVLKAAITPATTTGVAATPTNPWAADIVGQSMADFLNQLPIAAIYPRLAAKGAKFTFGRNGTIKVPSRSSTPKINGSFVGEGQPIPVRRLGLASILLTPKKMAVISEFTREIAMTSTPSIESVIRQAMNEDTMEAIDTVLIDAVAADAIRPHGLRYNQFTAAAITGLTPSAATLTFDKMVADIKALMAPIVAARGGRDLVLLMNPAQQLGLSWVATPNGDFVFASAENGQLRNITVITSTTVPATMLIMIDAADFASATGDTPEFDVSDVATIHEEDTTPLPIVGGTVQPPVIGSIAAPVRSLWQTASIGVRMMMDMNWAMRRPNMVTWMTGVTW